MSIESDIIDEVVLTRTIQKQYGRFRDNGYVKKVLKQEEKLDKMLETYQKLKKGF